MVLLSSAVYKHKNNQSVFYQILGSQNHKIYLYPVFLFIIIIALTSVFYACMDQVVSQERLQSIFVFSQVFADFPFFQITFDYLISLGCPKEKQLLTFKVLNLLDQHTLPFFLDDQTTAVFYPVNIVSCSSALAQS